MLGNFSHIPLCSLLHMLENCKSLVLQDKCNIEPGILYTGRFIMSLLMFHQLLRSYGVYNLYVKSHQKENQLQRVVVIRGQLRTVRVKAYVQL